MDIYPFRGFPVSTLMESAVCDSWKWWSQSLPLPVPLRAKPIRCCCPVLWIWGKWNCHVGSVLNWHTEGHPAAVEGSSGGRVHWDTLNRPFLWWDWPASSSVTFPGSCQISSLGLQPSYSICDLSYTFPTNSFSAEVSNSHFLSVFKNKCIVLGQLIH